MPDTGNTSKPDPAAADALIASALRIIAPGTSCAVAYSGGRDSSVLLHALAHLRPELPLRALHVDHGLHAASADWAEFCARSCRQLGVEFQALRPDGPAAQSNREAWAREQRYALLVDALRPGEVLLTAHHQRDQAETLLLNLLRGSGAEGLAAMPVARSVGDHQLLRPLLGVSAERMAFYARAHGLNWIEDPSNAATNQDRNFLRHEVLPLLASRFGRVEANLARSAALLGEIDHLEPDWAVLAPTGALQLDALAEINAAGRNHVLRCWLRRQDLPSPRYRMLSQLWQQCLAAGPDRLPVIRWPGCELRRYRRQLFAMRPLVEATPIDWTVTGTGRRDWPWGGEIRWCLHGEGQVHTLQGGEVIELAQGRRRLKTLFQAAGVPPWERRRLPLLSVDGRLVAVADRWRAADFPDTAWCWRVNDSRL